MSCNMSPLFKKKKKSLHSAYAHLSKFPRIDDRHCYRIYSSLTDVYCFGNGYVGKAASG